MIVQVTTATKIDKSTIEKIQTAVEKKYQQKVDIKSVVNKNVIGGISLTIGSNHFDNTVKHKLSQIKKQLNKNL